MAFRHARAGAALMFFKKRSQVKNCLVKKPKHLSGKTVVE